VYVRYGGAVDDQAIDVTEDIVDLTKTSTLEPIRGGS
jgi:hypothetical protein